VADLKVKIQEQTGNHVQQIQ